MAWLVLVFACCKYSSELGRKSGDPQKTSLGAQGSRCGSAGQSLLEFM